MRIKSQRKPLETINSVRGPLLGNLTYFGKHWDNFHCQLVCLGVIAAIKIISKVFHNLIAIYQAGAENFANTKQTETTIEGLQINFMIGGSF